MVSHARLMVFLGMVACATPSAAIGQTVVLSSEPAIPSACALLDDTPGVRTVYIFYLFDFGASAVRFRITSEPGVTMTYVSETHPFPMTIGDTQSGITICFGTCLTGAGILATMSYMAYGTSTPCSQLDVARFSGAPTNYAMSCDSRAMAIWAGGVYIGAPGQICGCPRILPVPAGASPAFDCSPVPVEPKTWGAIKSLYR